MGSDLTVGVISAAAGLLGAGLGAATSAWAQKRSIEAERELWRVEFEAKRGDRFRDRRIALYIDYLDTTTAFVASVLSISSNQPTAVTNMRRAFASLTGEDVESPTEPPTGEAIGYAVMRLVAMRREIEIISTTEDVRVAAIQLGQAAHVFAEHGRVRLAGNPIENVDQDVASYTAAHGKFITACRTEMSTSTA
jgi:hypothetical protein